MSVDSFAVPEAGTAPTVSIIIPAYNAERFIEETLRSILDQDYKDLEIIVVDDGSTDRTRDLTIASPHVRYFSQHNQGPAIARNVGLKLARGKYVAFMDADDFWHPFMLSSCVQILETKPEIGAVHAKWVITDEHGRVTQDNAGWSPWRGKVFERLLVDIAFVTPSIIWRRALWDEIGGIDLTPEINDDWFNWLQIAFRDTLFDCIEAPLVYVRKHRGSLSWTQSSRVVRWRLNALDKICKQCQVSLEVQTRAYARTYWIATVESITHDEDKEAVDYFLQAVVRTPEILVHSSTYYELAYAQVGVTILDRPDLVRSERDIRLLLDGIFGVAGLTESVLLLKQQAESSAYFSLSQIAYGLDDHWGRAVSFLLRSLRAKPSIIWNFERAMWAVRIVLGKTLTGQGRELCNFARQRLNLPNNHPETIVNSNCKESVAK